jgi:hypothetical protein
MPALNPKPCLAWWTASHFSWLQPKQQHWCHWSASGLAVADGMQCQEQLLGDPCVPAGTSSEHAGSMHVTYVLPAFRFARFPASETRPAKPKWAGWYKHHHMHGTSTCRHGCVHDEAPCVAGQARVHPYSLIMHYMQHNSSKTSLHEYGPGSTLPWGVLGST